VEYDHNRIVNLTADGDKATTLSIGVFKGNASLVVFSNKSLAAKFSLSRDLISAIRKKLISTVTAAPGTKVVLNFSKFDPDQKKWISTGALVIGKDDKSMVYFGVTAPNTPAMKFPMKTAPSFDFSEPLSDPDKSILKAETVIEQFTTDIPMALMLTSEKRAPGGFGGGGGGNRSSGGDSGGDIF
jgi:hypothetical protein